MAVFCSRCGTSLPVSARFCSSCGADVPQLNGVRAGRPLMRPRQGRTVAGVCLALSRSYGWDVAVVRILTTVGLFFSGGLVAVAYLAGWIGIPEEPLTIPVSYPQQ